MTNTIRKPHKHTMAPRHFWHLLSKMSWVYVFLHSSMISAMDGPEMCLKSKVYVYVAFKGETLDVCLELKKPVNETNNLICSDPSGKQICQLEVPQILEKYEEHLKLEKLNISGQYYCQYKRTSVTWFVLVRDEGYKSIPMYDTEFIIVAVFISLLLIFSVVGSVCVFRGNWKDGVTKHEGAANNQIQNKEEKETRGSKGDNMDVSTAQSTSFYASLEPRPRSIYDVLEPSAVTTESDQKKPRSKKKGLQKMVEKTPELQNEGVFESVYENF
ncbi:NFAT activation molecule 1 [Pholidichthys leucotaenia]